MYSVLVGTW